MAAGGGDDAISEAGAVWRAWVALVSPGALPPLLKSGSAGPQSAGVNANLCIYRLILSYHLSILLSKGFMLKSVEKMFGCVGPDMSWARLQGTRCWQTIVDSIVEIEVGNDVQLSLH